MPLYLETASGLLASHSIALIGGINRRPTGNYHLIFYTVGAGAERTTRASEEAVNNYLDALARANLNSTSDL
jgi:hypothetical protein